MAELDAESRAEELQEKSRQKNWRGFAIRVAGSAIVLALLFYLLPRDKLAEALNAFSIELWVAGVSTYLVLHLIGVAKWRMLINASGGDLSGAQAARCYYYGLFGNTFLPSVVGGDLIRAALAMRLSRHKGAVLVGSVVDRAIDSLGLATVAAVGALMIPMSLDENSRGIFWGFAALAATGGVTIVAVIMLMPVSRIPMKWRRRLVKGRQSFRLLAQDWSKMLFAFCAAIVLQVSQVLMSTWLGRLAKIFSVGFLTWLFVWPVAKLSAMAPFTQGGIGVREAVQGTLFIPFGVSMDKAVATGLMFQAIVITGNLLGGAIAAILGWVSAGSRETVAKESRSRQPRYAFTVAGALALFFIASALTLATGTGAIDPHSLNWMSALPAYSADFTGALVGLGYGAVGGFLLGAIVSRLSPNTDRH